tara:strand:- start:371 stop:784 length:414 start_codon:yes stop_codon:yes gene_type:complete
MKLIKTLKFFSLLLVLFIILFVIYYFTNKNHFKNEYFTVPDKLLNASLSASYKQKDSAANTKNSAYRNLVNIGKLNRDRKEAAVNKIRNLDHLKNQVNEMRGDINKVNQNLFILRNGNSFSDKPEERVGIFDTTLLI